ncbi:MAG: CHAP domain-containing protein [Alphaproteobacteria bacterium]|nr:CHAP domain-containing protein [Alphaproteobacteria bacterium]MBU0797433.1 CHAP domain-containing protein [Alphaproteobacteria bacterium]MBU0888552.1 CHAP domain-containing protein [Alphaproteobacteria bacterium]MBU1813714.1 CHAP domain-containing protein [Alphaproteobacteria bacterium]
MRVIATLFLVFILAGCAAGPKTPPAAPSGGSVAYAPQNLAPSPLRPYPETDAFLQCVPFARAVSGIQIYGDAGTWWDKAARDYARGNRPQIGAVLSLRPTQRMRLGHVAVVVAVQDSRRILVSHANWGGDSSTRGKIHSRQPVVDVSPNNDWSEVRLMNTLGTFGSVYPAHGFIYQQRNVASAASAS